MKTEEIREFAPNGVRLRQPLRPPKDIENIGGGHRVYLNGHDPRYTLHSVKDLTWVRCPECGKEVVVGKRGNIAKHQGAESVSKFNGRHPLCPASRTPYCNQPKETEQ